MGSRKAGARSRPPRDLKSAWIAPPRSAGVCGGGESAASIISRASSSTHWPWRAARPCRRDAKESSGFGRVRCCTQPRHISGRWLRTRQWGAPEKRTAEKHAGRWARAREVAMRDGAKDFANLLFPIMASDHVPASTEKCPVRRGFCFDALSWAGGQAAAWVRRGAAPCGASPPRASCPPFAPPAASRAA